MKTSSLLYSAVPHCTRRHSSLLAFARIAQTWLQLSSVSSEGCHLHTKAGHLQAGTEFSVADFASGAVSAMCKDYQTSGSRRALRGTSRWVEVSSGEQPVLMHPRFETAHNKPLPLPVATSEATAQRREKDEPPEHFVPLAKIKTDRRICLSATTLYNNNHTKIPLSMLSRILVLISMVLCLPFHNWKMLWATLTECIPADSCLYNILFICVFVTFHDSGISVRALLTSYRTR